MANSYTWTFQIIKSAFCEFSFIESDTFLFAKIWDSADCYKKKIQWMMLLKNDIDIAYKTFSETLINWIINVILAVILYNNSRTWIWC